MLIYIILILLLLIYLFYTNIDKNIFDTNIDKNVDTNVFRKNVLEKFNGSHPNNYNNAWTLGDVVEKYDSSCNSGGECNTKNGEFGHYNDNCDCILKKTVQSDSMPILASDPVSPPVSAPVTKSVFERLPSCIPNQDFSTYCKNAYGSTYGIKNIIPCDSSTSNVECGQNFIGGVNYGDNVTITPCLNKSDDFDTWCRYYTDNSKLPPGYNVNSIGTQQILKGINGDCYLNNGIPDTNSARAICDYNNIETIPRLEPANTEINYNKFTSCLPINDDTFVNECKTLFTDDSSNVLATQIMGYDCNPGYGRAKCVKSKSDKIIFNSDFYNQTYTTEHNDLTKSCDSMCS